MNFYYTLKSTDFIGECSPANWKTKIPQTINFDEDWEVAVAQIFYSCDWLNIFEDEKIELYYYYDNEKKKAETILPKGHYSIEELVNTINRLFKSLLDSLNLVQIDYPKIGISMKDRVKYVVVKLGGNKNKYIFPIFSKYLSGLLGIDRNELNYLKREYMSRYNSETMIRGEEYIPDEYDSRIVTTDQTYDIAGGYHTFYLYTDIIEPEVVGDKFVQLIKIVQIPYNAKHGEQVHLSYDNGREYRKINLNEISTIEVRLVDDAGRNIQFSDTAFTLIVLHFRQVNKKNDIISNN